MAKVRTVERRDRTAIVCGKGVSLGHFDWTLAVGLDVVAISSTIACMGRRKVRHWICVDQPHHFDQKHVKSSKVQKQVPEDREWNGFPNVRQWPVVFNDYPQFKNDVTVGSFTHCHSLLFGVQVLYQLGYRKLVFVGCDMHDPRLWPVVERMEAWHSSFKDHGMTWVCSSELSLMSVFMPTMGCSVEAEI